MKVLQIDSRLYKIFLLGKLSHGIPLEALIERPFSNDSYSYVISSDAQSCSLLEKTCRIYDNLCLKELVLVLAKIVQILKKHLDKDHKWHIHPIQSLIFFGA